MITSCANILLESDVFGLGSKQKKEFIEKLDAYIQKSRARPPKEFNDLNPNTQSIVQKLRDDYRLQVEMKYHDDIRNLVIKKQVVEAAMSSNNPMKYLLNMLEGGWGQRLSIDYQGKSGGGRLLTMFLHDLEKNDLIDIFRDGKLSDEIFNDLHLVYKAEQRSTGATGTMWSPSQIKKFDWSGNEQAKKIAEIIHYHDKVSVSKLNMSNARIRMSADRLFNKAPDQMKIRGLGKTQEDAWQVWKGLANEHFNLDEMFELVPEHLREKELKEIFLDYYNGVHIRSEAGDDINLKFINPNNLGRKVSRRNRIIYKSGSDASSYLDRVGYKGYNLQHAISFGLEHDGRNAALLENLGTNPEAMLRSVVSRIKSEMKKDWDKYDKFSHDMVNQSGRDGIPQKLRHSLEILNGTTRSPENVRMAAIGASVRAFKNMALLGFAAVRSANDMITMAFSAKKNGIPFSTIIREAPTAFIKGFELPLLGIKADVQQRRIASLIGLGPRALVADVVGKFGADDALPGFITKMQRQYFKMNLLTYWNDAMKTSFSMMLSHHLALESLKPWHHKNKNSRIMDEVKKMLTDFGITPAEWDAIRHSAVWKAEDGRTYMSPDRLENPDSLTDETIRALIRMEKGPKEHLDNVANQIKENTPEELRRHHDESIVNIEKKLKELKKDLSGIKDLPEVTDKITKLEKTLKSMREDKEKMDRGLFEAKQLKKKSPEELIKGKEKAIINIEKKVEELEEKIAKIKTKKSREEMHDEKSRYEGALQQHRTERKLLEDIENKEVSAEDIARWTDEYMQNVQEREMFNVKTSKMLQKHYRTKDAAENAMALFMGGMDTKKRDEFEQVFARFWDKRRNDWDVDEMRLFMNHNSMKELFRDTNPYIDAEANEWLSRPKQRGKIEPGEKVTLSRAADIAENWGKDPQEAFTFMKEMGDKEKKEAWGKFLKLMSEDEEHMHFIHNEIQRAWKKEKEFLFKGHVEKGSQGEFIKWHKPALYKYMQSKVDAGEIPGKGLWKEAQRIEDKTAVQRSNLPGWMTDYVKSYMSQDIKEHDIMRKRNQLATKLTTLFYDRNDHAVLIPGAKEKRLMTQGQRSGTILGEAVRFIGQFKTFPVTLMTKSLMQEIDGKQLGQIRGNEVVQLAKFIAGMTMMGAITTVATDFLRNKTTRDTFDPTSPEFMNLMSGPGFRNLVDAFVYGGGAGFYGDILAQPYGNGKNFSAIKSLLGPTFSQYDDIIDVTLGVLNGDAKAKKAFSLLLQNFPGQNLFYGKTALDYLLNYQMQDIIDPTYHSRQYSRMQKENLQSYRNTPVGIFQ